MTTSPPNKRVRIFISHSTRDKRDHALAHGLGDRLQAVGAEVWIAPVSIPAGAKWEEAIVSGILDQCTHFLVILSAASASAEWVAKEIALARQRHARDGFTILPLVVGRLDTSPERDLLSDFQEVPFRDETEAQVEELARVLGLSYTPPPPPRRLQDAVGYLQRCMQLDNDQIRQVRLVRSASPFPGAGLAIFLVSAAEQLPRAIVAAVVAGAPAITFAVGAGMFVLMTAAARAKINYARELESGLTSCPDVYHGSCAELWNRYEEFRADRIRKGTHR